MQITKRLIKLQDTVKVFYTPLRQDLETLRSYHRNTTFVLCEDACEVNSQISTMLPMTLSRVILKWMRRLVFVLFFYDTVLFSVWMLDNPSASSLSFTSQWKCGLACTDPGRSRSRLSKVALTSFTPATSSSSFWGDHKAFSGQMRYVPWGQPCGFLPVGQAQFTTTVRYPGDIRFPNPIHPIQSMLSMITQTIGEGWKN